MEAIELLGWLQLQVESFVNIWDTSQGTWASCTQAKVHKHQLRPPVPHIAQVFIRRIDKSQGEQELTRSVSSPVDGINLMEEEEEDDDDGGDDYDNGEEVEDDSGDDREVALMVVGKLGSVDQNRSRRESSGCTDIISPLASDSMSVALASVSVVLPARSAILAAFSVLLLALSSFLSAFACFLACSAVASLSSSPSALLFVVDEDERTSCCDWILSLTGFDRHFLEAHSCMESSNAILTLAFCPSDWHRLQDLLLRIMISPR